nr:MAG TPA: hypothetical protein [Caudoviricetes sp.]
MKSLKQVYFFIRSSFWVRERFEHFTALNLRKIM